MAPWVVSDYDLSCHYLRFHPLLSAHLTDHNAADYGFCYIAVIL